ncbi:metal-independent alpha-mannosidase [Cohnella sp. CFH 77786]|uniref:glycoside hydrolase family 125 protein n=1 Tax=Cohnella sp. CFH 77786 TaxID=2662265 RepID=UPI001C60E2DC|nr:glycoside hydrolase family 125 protein [Cohnella sp. CFH 77786]MBW5447551.1 metal-independent alpha-mannosidase [Cohnella sp. CFH 77786]
MKQRELMNRYVERPAMWLRDSSARVRHYLPIAAEDEVLQSVIEGLIRRQLKYIGIDPYTGYMHEGFRKDDPSSFTRPWFAWANSLFAEFAVRLAEDSEPERKD